MPYYAEQDGSWPYVVDKHTGERVCEVCPAHYSSRKKQLDRAKWVAKALNLLEKLENEDDN